MNIFLNIVFITILISKLYTILYSLATKILYIIHLHLIKN